MFTLTRNDNSASLALPQDMRWTDEFDWSATAQTAPVYTLSGAVVIQQGQKQAGRPITLAGEWVWLDLGIIRTLRDWSDVPELVMTLTHYDGRRFNVMWRLHDKALRNVSPIAYRTPERADDRYTAEICLMTV
ncbi:hypothetical protein [Kingella oralis]|uniref:hypothetical protein n=1 Tax=Kingella oralis TaxID=505 RepID=UPI0034E508CB